MKILVSAYACEPGQGSEPGVGWNHVKQIAQFHDVWAITRSNNRSVIEKELSRDPMPNVRWVYFDLPRWARFWKKGQRGVRSYYYFWQIGIYFTALRLHRKVQFDLAQHVTFGMYWMPTFLPFLSIPFVWGPVGGGESVPRNFRRTFSARGKIYEALRNCARKLGELDPFVRFAASQATIALATSNQTEERLRALGCRNISVLSSVGLPPEELRELMALPLRQCAPFRVVSVGRLLHWKGFEFGLRAFADFHAHFPRSEYWFIGDGPERRPLERLARKMGLNGPVVFWGMLARVQVLAKFAECDVLLFPSLHDSGGYVSLEAMAAGRPVICLDLGGPALQVTPETGVKVAAVSPEQVVEHLAIALATLAGDPTRRVRMSQAGRERVRQFFSRESKGRLMEDIYREVRNGHQ